MANEFEDKVVVVTGSSSGIGTTTALAFARLGARVVVTGRNASNVEEVAKQCQLISPQNYQVNRFVGDLSEDPNVDLLINLVIDKYNRLDVLVNNAGRAVQWSEQTAMKDLDDMYKVNLRSVYYLCLKALPLLQRSKGVIINNSSMGSLVPLIDLMGYSVSKAGLDMLTRCLAIKWGPMGIRVNSVNPGYIRTPIFGRLQDQDHSVDESQLELMWKAVREKNPLRREGTTEDVANAILFLASNNSSFITGALLRIDGNIFDCASTQLPMPNDN